MVKKKCREVLSSSQNRLEEASSVIAEKTGKKGGLNSLFFHRGGVEAHPFN